MDPLVSELLRGPKSAKPNEQIAWLLKVHQTCAQAPEQSLRKIAPPLKKAADLLAKSSAGTEKEQEEAEPHVTGLLLQAQGLAIYSYLEELNRLRNTIDAEAAKQKPGSENRKKAEALQAAYEETIDGLARAYKGLREGELDEMKAAVELLEKSRAAADLLRVKTEKQKR